MLALGAETFLVRGPLKLLTVAFLAEIAGERTDLQEAQKRKKFSNPILHGSARQAPFIVGFQGETSLRDARGTLLYKSVSN